MWLHTPDPQTALQLLVSSSQKLASARHLFKGRAIWGFGRRKRKRSSLAPLKPLPLQANVATRMLICSPATV